jgi:hypothetical protein
MDKKFDILNKSFDCTKDGGYHYYLWGKVVSLTAEMAMVEMADGRKCEFGIYEINRWIADKVLLYTRMYPIWMIP